MCRTPKRSASPSKVRITLLASLIVIGQIACNSSRRNITAEQVGTAPPNIVVFMVDDLGWQDVQLPLADSATVFNRRYRTPALMALAARGMTFTNAYAAATVCTPTRVAFITGRAPAETHITNWTQHKNEETSSPFPGLLPPDWARNGASPDENTDHAFHAPMLPALLQQAGYRTIHAGKAHWGATNTPGADPRALGFDVNIGGSSAGQPGSHLGTKSYSSGPGAGKFRDVPGLDRYHGTNTFLSDALTIEANAAIRDAVRDGKPFFLHLAHYSVHTPIEPDPRFVQRYLDAGLDAREAAYASQVEGVDRSLADVVSQLEALGVLPNTMIVFVSDNGGLAAHSRGGTPHTANAPLRSGKGSAYEGGLRVPMVIAWPTHVREGVRSSVPVITDDLFPTLLAMARVPDAAQYTRGIRGRDLQPLLRGETVAWSTDRPLTWHYPHFWGVAGPGIEPFSAIRIGSWKLIFYYKDRRIELFDLANDLGESRNVAAAQRAITSRMVKTLSDVLRAANAQMPVDSASGRAVAFPSLVR